MNIFLQTSLIAHIFFGLIGIMAFYAASLALLKWKINLRFLRLSALAGLVSFFLSWAGGAYYYLSYYGKDVRPLVKSGHYPWAHGVFMETKEHIFLFLPFLALAAAFLFYLYGNKLETDEKLKKWSVLLCVLITLIGTAVTLAGVVVSGAVRQ